MTRVGRNDPCPCGSGAKYKKCCQRRDEQRAAAENTPEVDTNNAIQVAVQHFQSARYSEVEAICQSILASRPDHPDALALSGLSAHLLGRNEVAAERLRRVLLIQPSAKMHYNLGVVLQAQGRLDDAIESYRAANAITPDYETFSNLGTVLQKQGKLSEAVKHYHQALSLKPSDAAAHNNLGEALRQQGLWEEAIKHLRRALEIAPNFLEAYGNLGLALREQGRLEEALGYSRRALALNPAYALAHCNMGSILHGLGNAEDAITHYRQALAIRPDLTEAHTSLIFALDLATGVDIHAQQAERRRWDQAHAARLMQAVPHANTPDPERRLRVGYVSADFRRHSAAVVFGAMLVHFDRAHYDVFAYSNTKKEDGITERFRNQVTCWRNILHQPDDAVADLIRHDGIDILVDLSAHSGGNRLLVFARKPAPIQITAWGYATSTGMAAMDVFFADPVTVPPEERQLFSEEVRYLPNMVGSYFADPFPEVNELPALSQGGITFGSFNRLAKTSHEVFDVWGQVLAAVPGSRLLLKSSGMDDPAARDGVTERFLRAGIPPERIVLQGNTPWFEHMRAFNQIDIALDPFPQGGGVTTLETIRMGIPVVTLRRPTIAGRVSASILTTLGLTDWIAETPEQYVAIAVRKAQDIAALAALRKGLRGIFDASPIGSAQAYVQAVEGEYRQIWRAWCRSQAAGTPS